MRLTVLGGSAACPNPGQGCSAYLLEAEGQYLLLDCGPDTLATLQEHIALDQLDGVLISHLHADHLLDLVPLRYGLKYMPGLARNRIPLWMPPGGRAFLHQLASVLAMGDERSEVFFEDVFMVAEYDPSRLLQLGPFQIRFRPTRHYVPCWACRIEVDGRTIVYLADTGPDDDLADLARSATVLICEATLSGDPDPVEGQGGVRGHLSAREAGALAAAAGAERLVLTHYWASLGVDALRREAEDAFGQTVQLAQPGWTIVLD
mgnify:CR=1 FL=1